MDNPPLSSSDWSTRNERRAFRTTIVFAALIIVALWSFVLWSSHRSHGEALAESGREVEQMTYAVEEQSRHMLKLVEVFMISIEQWIIQNPQADPRVDPRLAAMVGEFRKATNESINVRLITEDGALHALPASTAEPLTNVADRDYLRVPRESGKRGLYIGIPVESRVTGKWVLPISYLLPPSRHKVVMATATIELAVLGQLFEQLRVPASGTIAMIRNDGIILARVPFEANLIGRSVSSGEVFHSIGQGKTRGVMIIKSVVDGRERQFGYAVLPDYPVVLAVSAGIQEALAEWRRNLTVAITVATLLSGLVLLTLWRQLSLLRSLAASRAQLQILAATDAMTGTLNHTAFMDVLARDFARSRRYGEALTVLMLDIDFFKRINDGYGHAVGDDALRSFARILKGELRTVDAIGRLGGEEFGVILPNTGGAAAAHLAERLREQVAAIVVRSPRKEEVRFTTSIGVAQMDVHDLDPERLLARADAALYEAKAQGRNRVEIGAPSVDAA